jgi:hypothetical protein
VNAARVKRGILLDSLARGQIVAGIATDFEFKPSAWTLWYRAAQFTNA